jgi:hypothetical protein
MRSQKAGGTRSRCRPCQTSGAEATALPSGWRVRDGSLDQMIRLFRFSDPKYSKFSLQKQTNSKNRPNHSIKLFTKIVLSFPC